MRGNRKWLGFDAAGTPSVIAVALMCVFAVSSAQAVSVRVVSETNLAEESAFTLDFGEFGDIDGLGALRTGLITRTDLEIVVDPDAGFALFTRYDQDVEPIILPGGLDTGNIRVELVPGSSSGMFDRLTGVFVTEEEYAIYFEGDLSAYGLESPVIFPSSSTGVVSLDELTIGSVVMEWNGESVIGSGENAVPFTYTCVVVNQFVPGVESLLALQLGPEVLNLELRDPYGSRLFTLTQLARRAMDRNWTIRAETALLRFVDMVEDGVRERVIDPTDGANLIFDAEFTIELILDIKTPWAILRRR